MMRGTKRLASSESNPVLNDSMMQSKRILVGSPFDANRAEPSFQQQQQQQGTTSTLDMQRAELSRQHVRALNEQFASWIQTQLQDHPDELWEDGVQDYLNYASSIMEKFRDVVNWLKENAAKGESSSLLGSHATQKTLTSENKENDCKSAPDKPGIAPAFTTVSFGSSWSSGAQKNLLAQNKENDTKSSSEKPVTAPAATTPSFGNSWSSGLFSNNKPPFSFGIQTSVPAIQNSVPPSHNTSNEEDGEDVEQPSSPSVKKTEEKGIVVVHEVKCKLYVKSTDPADKDSWKDKGMGQLSIKCKEGVSKGTKESKPTIVVRNDVGKVVLNALLYPGIKTNMQKNSVVAIFHTSGDGDNNDTVVARTFLMRTKTEEDRNKLAAIIQEYAPTA